MDKSEIMNDLIKLIDSGFVSGSGLNRIKEMVTQLTSEYIEYCDIVIAGSGENQFILKTKTDVFRLKKEDGRINIYSDNENKIKYNYDI